VSTALRLLPFKVAAQPSEPGAVSVWEPVKLTAGVTPESIGLPRFSVVISEV
jgi:hypothetical protein